MKRRPTKSSRKTAKSPKAFRLTPAERAVEEIRERRKKLWKKLGSAEAVEAEGRRIWEAWQAAKKTRKRSA